MRHVDGLTNTQRETGRKGGRERENGMTLNTFRHLIRHQDYTLYPRPGRDLFFLSLWLQVCSWTHGKKPLHDGIAVWMGLAVGLLV